MEVQIQKPVTAAQIKKIHVLLSQKKLMDEKETMIRSVSGDRAVSTKELTYNEANVLIGWILDEPNEAKIKMEKYVDSIWLMAWNMGIIYGDTDDDFQMNKAKMNMFCRQRGAVKKDFTNMNLIEMKKIFIQFKTMYKKYLNNKKSNNK